MNAHDACEQAHKNGYEKGFNEGVEKTASVLLEKVKEHLDDIEITGAYSKGKAEAFRIVKSILCDRNQLPSLEKEKNKKQTEVLL